MFWDLYHRVEKGTKVSLEEFKNNKELKNDVKNAIIQFYSYVVSMARKVINIDDDEKLFFELFKKKIIDSLLLQELIDIREAIINLDKIDDDILYSLLVRILEDLEELFYSIKKFLS
ncbi:hypothetical protein DFR86_02655 [Acidianus sulfidivorans JP7]|uniref:DUF86 domain-containing protein n=1 Tax=Acidianus sulfidivorans JP7 TaxID=619593 RepID=A0A2U9IKN7_9CREN|nr:hypothetical protein [Acidianus sulfidivorans]AWR96556.1 hypothetical protein DFR86_02655 [Acidianus sulfidivorans JP7]